MTKVDPDLVQWFSSRYRWETAREMIAAERMYDGEAFASTPSLPRKDDIIVLSPSEEQALRDAARERAISAMVSEWKQKVFDTSRVSGDCHPA